MSGIDEVGVLLYLELDTQAKMADEDDWLAD